MRVISVTLFDADAASHPSPRDSSWAVTNAEIVAQIYSLADGDPVLPSCPTVGSMEVLDRRNLTNRFGVLHIHNPSTIVLCDHGGAVVKNGQEVLQRLAHLGFPTNKLFALGGSH